MIIVKEDGVGRHGHAELERDLAVRRGGRHAREPALVLAEHLAVLARLQEVRHHEVLLVGDEPPVARRLAVFCEERAVERLGLARVDERGLAVPAAVVGREERPITEAGRVPADVGHVEQEGHAEAPAHVREAPGRERGREHGPRVDAVDVDRLARVPPVVPLPVGERDAVPPQRGRDGDGRGLHRRVRRGHDGQVVLPRRRFA